MRANIFVEVKNGKLNFAMDRPRDKLEDVLILISSLRLLIKNLEDEVVTNFKAGVEQNGNRNN